MKSYGLVYSTVKPDLIKIDEYSIWESADVNYIKDDNIYSYTLNQYTKDEYIVELSSRDKAKSDALLELSSMMAEIIEGNEVNG